MIALFYHYISDKYVEYTEYNRDDFGYWLSTNQI